MNRRIILGLSATALLASAGAASAATEDGISSLHACANFHWNATFLSYFPKAAAACRDVTQKNGIIYAKFDGRVADVDSRYVRVEISDVANIPIAKVEFRKGSGGTVDIDNQVVRIRDLKVDDQLTFWLRNGQFGREATANDQRVAVLRPEATFSR